MINCPVSTDFGYALAFDACTENVILTHNTESIPGTCPQEYIWIRTWTATDGCGNYSTCSASIEVQDTLSPTINCPPDLVLECVSGTNYIVLINNWIATAQASDACDSLVSIFTNFSGTAIPEVSCDLSAGLEIVFTAIDDCGNTATCSATVYITDSSSPQLECPPDLVLECEIEADYQSLISDWINSVTALDNCNDELVIENDYDGISLPIVSCDLSTGIPVLFTATDACGNTSECLRVIYIDDETPPIIDLPDDLVLVCDENVNYVEEISTWLIQATAFDDCIGGLSVENDYDGITVPDFSCSDGMTLNFTSTDGCGNVAADERTVYKPCFEMEVWLYLEGATTMPNGESGYELPMRTTLNQLLILPGQTYDDFFSGPHYTLPGQPYNVPPWDYPGTEGDLFDSEGNPAIGQAGYPPSIVDWVFVSLRDQTGSDGSSICEAAALLHDDGRIEFVQPLNCCSVIEQDSYYLVIEHRNHLIMMSHVPVQFEDHNLTYDFRNQQSYIDDPFNFGVFSGQKEIMTGQYAMIAGNGNQTLSEHSDTDINFDDRSFWETENGDFGEYRTGDYNLNGDTNFNDRITWNRNNGRFTSVPRN